MPLPEADTEVRTSSETAELFVARYYEALNRNSTLLPFYMDSTARYTTKADISINGAIVTSPAEYSKLLEEQGPGVHYEAESFDTHVLNPSFAYSAPDHIPDQDMREKKGERMSVAVTVMGKVRYGKGKDAPVKMFNETFVLVPNWDAMVRNPPRGIRRWLIMSQNFRAL